MTSLELTVSSLTERFVASVTNDAAVRADLARLQLPLAGRVHRVELRAALDQLSRALRTDLAILSFVEALHSLSATSVSAARTLSARVLERAHLIAGFDVRPFLSSVADSAVSPAADGDLQVERVREVFSRHVLASLAAFPAEEVKALTSQLDDAETAHRIFQDAQKLAGIARRADDIWSHRFKDAGALFLEGRIEIADLARLWGRAPEEVAAEFERLGFVRSLEAIELGEAERNRRLAQISRAGAVSRALVARDVIASQRIEGIDARSHDAVTELSLPDER